MTRSTVQQVIIPEIADLGEFSVKRSLPAPGRKMVGPFIFYDHVGPAEFAPGKGVSVRPHPHIGIATVTYLFDGEIVHRDSLGFVQAIQPGAVNWMTAGRGIVHSERSRPELIESGSTLHGIQAWVALPLQDEECEPDFTHYPADSLPQWESGGVWMRLLAGNAYGMQSQVRTRSEMFYLEARAQPGRSCRLPGGHIDRAIYTVEGRIEIDGEEIAVGVMLVFDSDSDPQIRAIDEARFMLLGGQPLEGRRSLWWNFVSSRKDRIETAKADWKQGRFDPVPGETEFIPLPEK
jgi:redox-sensitive bicupin YhaK (pirin superfamily)